ncbi:DUF6492 family protein [soil metagenome]
MTSRLKDLPILKLAVEHGKRFLPASSFHVFTAAANFRQFAKVLGDEVELIDQDKAIPGMTLEILRALDLPGFPAGAGWYFQQLLKYSFYERDGSNGYFLIWDADTIPLRPLEFLDAEGRILLTAAPEFHEPYFENIVRLLGIPVEVRISFISQHALVDRAILREMLGLLVSRASGENHWAWAIMRELRGTSLNLFSEYETYGHYLAAAHPDGVKIRQLPWSRDGNGLVKGGLSPATLERLSDEYAFVAFESKQKLSLKWLLWIYQRLPVPLQEMVRRGR